MLFYHDTIYHQAKALVTDSTLLAGLLIDQSVRGCCLQPNHALSTNHVFYSSSILGQMFMDMERTC